MSIVSSGNSGLVISTDLFWWETDVETSSKTLCKSFTRLPMFGQRLSTCTAQKTGIVGAVEFNAGSLGSQLAAKKELLKIQTNQSCFWSVIVWFVSLLLFTCLLVFWLCCSFVCLYFCCIGGGARFVCFEPPPSSPPPVSPTQFFLLAFFLMCLFYYCLFVWKLLCCYVLIDVY